MTKKELRNLIICVILIMSLAVLWGLEERRLQHEQGDDYVTPATNHCCT